MDFSNPFTGMTPGRKLTVEELARAIRIDIAAELDAINLYQSHIDATDDEVAKQLIAHIRDEEKEHMAEFTALLNYLDSVQKAYFETAEIGEIEAGQTQELEVGFHPDEPPTEGQQMEMQTVNQGEIAQKTQPGLQSSMQFTVGSLLGQPQGDAGQLPS